MQGSTILQSSNNRGRTNPHTLPESSRIMRAAVGHNIQELIEDRIIDPVDADDAIQRYYMNAENIGD